MPTPQNKMAKKTVVILVILFSLGPLFLLWQWYSKKVNGKIAFAPPPATESVTAAKPAFHPDEIRKFRWRSGAVEFTFTRNARNAAWEPIVPPSFIHRRLLAFRDLNTAAGTLAGGNRWGVEIEIEDFSKISWRGVWSPGAFLWIDGPTAGQGADLSKQPELESLFKAGILAFTSRKLKWCPARITSIKNKNGEIKRRDGNWLAGRPVPGLGDLIETWMGRNCTFDVAEFVDPKFQKQSAVTNRLAFSFETGRAIELLQHEDGSWLMNGHDSSWGPTAFFSPELTEQVGVLTNILQTSK